MSVKPVPFSPPMVRALLEGRKTQTRRIPTRLRAFGPITQFGRSETPGYDWQFRDKAMRWHDLTDAELRRALPYAPGDMLWVREDHRSLGAIADGQPRTVRLRYDADGAEWIGQWPGRCSRPIFNRRRAPMHLPLEASRLTLRVTEVRVQRLQEISAPDAQAEGAAPECGHCRALSPCKCELPHPSHHRGFMKLWDSLNAQRGFGWGANPWVAAYSFELIKDNVDAVLARQVIPAAQPPQGRPPARSEASKRSAPSGSEDRPNGREGGPRQ